MSFRLSTKGRYGVRAIARLADDGSNQPVSIQTIANDEQIPVRYLEQLMNRLRKSGLVKSIRGARGGYQLTKPSDTITLGEIIEALEGKVAVSNCVEETKKSGCAYQGLCRFNPFWNELSQSIQNYLNHVYLSDLIQGQWKKNTLFTQQEVK